MENGTDDFDPFSILSRLRWLMLYVTKFTVPKMECVENETGGTFWIKK